MVIAIKPSKVRVGDAMMDRGRYYIVERILKTGAGKDAVYRFYGQGKMLGLGGYFETGWASVDRKET
jgi:hypothetical protein